MNRKMKLQEIRVDADMQARVSIDQSAVDEYAEAMKSGAIFPPLTVFNYGKQHWLADGFHRFHAAQRAGIDEIDAEIKDGSKRAATLFAVGANAAHGLRRNNADKRKAAATLLTDDEWKCWSDGKIAELCGVSDRFVSKLRAELSPNDSEMARMAERNGTQYRMKTERIGKRDVQESSACTSQRKLKHRSKSPLFEPREIVSDESIRQRLHEHHPGLDPNSWQRRLFWQPWTALAPESSAPETPQAILITMPKNIPSAADLETLVECARKLDCGVYMTLELQNPAADTQPQSENSSPGRACGVLTTKNAKVRRQKVPAGAPTDEDFLE